MNIASNIPNIPAGEPKPVGSPVHIFGQTGMLTCAAFYNWMWEQCCLDRDTFHMDSASIERIVEPIAEYLTALLFVRWAKCADVDIEDGLMGKICEVFEKRADIIESPLEELTVMCDHNEDDFIFSPEDLLSDWLGEGLSDAAGNLSGFGGGSMHVPDEEFIYTLGERPGHTKPCFRNEAFEHAFVAVHGQMSIVYGSLRCVGVEMTEIMRTGMFSKEAQHYAPYHDLDDCEVGRDNYRDIKKFVDGGIIRADNARIIVIGEEYDSLGVQCGLVQFMDLFDLIDDSIERLIIVQSSEGELVKRRMVELMESLGVPVLLDVSTSDEMKRVPGEVNHLVSHSENEFSYGLGGSWISQWRYKGDIPDSLVREMDVCMSCEVVYSMMHDLVAMEDMHMHSGLSGCYTEINDIVEHKMATLMKIILDDERDIGLVEESIAASSENGIMDNRATMLSSLYRMGLDEAGKSKISFLPLYDRMLFMQELYDREGIIVKPDAGMWARTIYDASADRDIVSDEEIFDEMLAHMLERKEKSAIESAIDAYDKGIPAADILA